MSTDQLIVQFYTDLVETQQSEVNREKKFGELVLSVGYTSMVEVAVIQGENLGTLTSFTILRTSWYDCGIPLLKGTQR